MVFSCAHSARKLESRVGLTCSMIIDLKRKLVAIERVRRQYFADISWGGPNLNGRNPSEDLNADMACQL